MQPSQALGRHHRTRYAIRRLRRTKRMRRSQDFVQRTWAHRFRIVPKCRARRRSRERRVGCWEQERKGYDRSRPPRRAAAVAPVAVAPVAVARAAAAAVVAIRRNIPGRCSAAAAVSVKKRTNAASAASGQRAIQPLWADLAAASEAKRRTASSAGNGLRASLQVYARAAASDQRQKIARNAESGVRVESRGCNYKD